jgi:ribonuclease BN (tRNA processing enzyme)
VTNATEALTLTVLGAGPAYSDHPGAIGAGYLVGHGSTHIVLDLGQGVFTRLAGEIEPSSLDALFVTHLHPDHFVDLVPLRHYLRWELRPERRLRVIGPRELGDRLDALHGDPGFTAAALDVEAVTDGELVTVGSLELSARRVLHTDDSYAFRVSAGDGTPALVYSGDCGRADDLLPLIRPGDALLSEVSFGIGPGDPDAAHLDAADVGNLATRSGAGRVLLTHLQMGYGRQATVDAVRALYDGPVDLVEPGFRTTLG